MSQSGIIAASLLGAFLLFLAAKNRLGTYTAVLWGNTASPLPKDTSSKSGSGSGSSGGSGSVDWSSVAEKAAMAYVAM